MRDEGDSIYFFTLPYAAMLHILLKAVVINKVRLLFTFCGEITSFAEIYTYSNTLPEIFDPIYKFVIVLTT